MSDAESRQTIVDEEHLKLLSVGYMVSGAMSALIALLGLFYMGMGVLMGGMMRTMSRSAAHPENFPPMEFGWFFGIIGFFFMAFFISVATAKFMTASYIRKRTSRTFCLVVAAFSCLDIPYGTILGVCTFMVLERPSVHTLFRQSPPR